MGLIEVREYLLNLVKYRGMHKVNPKKIDDTVIWGVRPDGTVELYYPNKNKVAATLVADTTSAAGYSKTVPSGKYWILKTAGGLNNNRATYYHTDIDGKVIANAGIAIPGTFWAVMSLRDIRVNAGQVVTINDANFVAADVCQKHLAYEEYDA
jgi:hypothetical protein